MPAEVIVTHVDREIALDAANPSRDWAKARPISFRADWQGKNPDPERETTVRILWSESALFLRFECRYRELCLFDDSEPSGRRDQLWDRDVIEAFLQPDPSRPKFYREFEVSPNGLWVDLDIFPGGRTDLKSGLQ